MENEEEGLIFGQVGYESVDPLFELCPRHFLTRPKVVMLLGTTCVCEARHLVIYNTHLTEIGNISVEILLVFFDDQVSFVFDLLAIAPVD